MQEALERRDCKIPAMITVLVALVAYLVGSLSFAVIVSRAYRLPDPHSYGSGNPGATHVLRSGRKSAAVLTLLGDALKGFVVVWAVRHWDAGPGIGSSDIAIAAIAVFAGHLYPVYFGFKGGKGVATAAGILFALSPWLGLATLATWAAAFAVTRMSSVGALTAAVAAPVVAVVMFGPGAIAAAVLLMGVLIVYRHRSNIRKLLAGTESRVGSRS